MRGKYSDTRPDGRKRDRNASGEPQPYRQIRRQPAARGQEDMTKGGYAGRHTFVRQGQRQPDPAEESRQKKHRAAQDKYERRIAQRRRELRRSRRAKAKWQQRRVFSLTNLLLALIGFLFIASFSVVLVLNLRTLYYYEIQAQELVQKTGMPAEAIRENYDVLIDYNLMTKRVKKLEFPDFPMSRQGEIHFREVKRIFLLVQLLCAASGIITVVWLVKKLLNRDYGSLKLMAVFTVLIPSALGILAIWNWDGFFTQFHKLFFKNNYWIFDPVTDPVINILPDVFFFHCLAAIIFFILLGGLITGAAYRFATRKYRRTDG